MSPANANRVQELLQHLDTLETRRTQPHEASVIAVAREAIFEELTKLARAEGLVIYRRGETLDAVSMVG